MRLLALYNKNSGADYHRVYMPMRYLEIQDGDSKKVVDLNKESITPKDLGECDVLFFNRMIPYDTMVMQKYKEVVGFKMVVDVDDYWILYKDHPLYFNFQRRNYAEQWKSFMGLADVVTTTNERLAEKIRPINSNVVVLPNALPEVEQFAYQPMKHFKTRAIYTGGNSHIKDIQVVGGALDWLEKNKLYERFEINYYNVTQSNFFSRFRGSLYKAPLPLDKYMRVYDTADFSFAPLLENEFNSCKSNLKIIESGMKRVPIIVSPVHPYLDDVSLGILTAKTSKEWTEAMNYFIENPSLREEEGEKLYQYVKENYNFDRINRERYSLFKKLVNDTGT